MDIIEDEIDNIIETSIHNLEAQSLLNESQGNLLNNSSIDNSSIDNSSIDNSSIGNSSTIIDSKDVEAFNVALHQYLKIEQEIKLLQDAIKIRIKTKQSLTETLGCYLQTNNISNVNLDGNYKGKKLETRIIYSSKGFSKKNVTEIICEELKNDAEIFDKIMASIGKTNTITEKLQLKICSDKPASNKTAKK